MIGDRMVVGFEHWLALSIEGLMASRRASSYYCELLSNELIIKYLSEQQRESLSFIISR